MHIFSIILFGVVCIVLCFDSIKAQYDDDNTPQKVRLEDLENEDVGRTAQQLPHAQPQDQYAYSQLADIRKQQLPIYTHTGSPVGSALQFYQQRDEEQAPKAGSPNYETHAENHYPPAVTHYTQNDIEVDDEQQQQQQQQHASSYQQSSDGYALRDRTTAYVLVPPFGDVDDADEVENGISAERNHLSPAAYLQRPPQPYATNQPPTHTRIVSYAPNEPSATPNQPAPLPLPQGISPAATLRSGVRYFSGNQLPDVQQHSQEETDTEVDEPNAHVYPQEYFPRGQPRIIYGNPHATLGRPIFTAAQSNQFAYAPARRPDAGALPTAAAVLPYPPSFISITTSAPPVLHDVQPSVRPAYYSRQFKPSPVDPVPDLFAGRQHKSLLDSYIPSWVVARMLQQQQQQQQQRSNYGYHTLAYPLATPYSRHFKRESKYKRKEAKTEANRKIVKKSLDAQAHAKEEEMLMSE